MSSLWETNHISQWKSQGDAQSAWILPRFSGTPLEPRRQNLLIKVSALPIGEEVRKRKNITMILGIDEIKDI